MIERKHVEAIRDSIRLHFGENGRSLQAGEETTRAIVAALAAADESPCVWTEDGGCILKTACGRYWQTLEDGDRIDFPHCPYCGRKITEANAASDGGEKEEGDA